MGRAWQRALPKFLDHIPHPTSQTPCFNCIHLASADFLFGTATERLTPSNFERYKKPVLSEGNKFMPPETEHQELSPLLSGKIFYLSAAIAGLLGILGGIGLFTFGYGQGASYLSNDPQACANCHVMQDHFDSWLKSSHAEVAVCNDCHLPHDPIGKWVTKSDNGFFHSAAFTLDNFHEPIQIKKRNARVTQNACLHCHKDFVHWMLPAEPGGDMQSCATCHADAGHALRYR